MPLKPGDSAPHFRLKNQNAQDVELKSLLGEGLVLLAFYPGDFTSVCTKEMVCFSEDYADFQNLDCKICGISCDSVEKHAQFKQAFGFPFDLLSDPDARVATAYGVKMPLLTKANRAVFIVTPDGRIGYAHKESLPIFRRSNKELLAAIRKLKPQKKL